MRESLKGQDLTFTEIAKVVGEKWQVLPAEEREGCERQANGAKEKYYAELAEYKKTPHFEAYQKYLEDFKSKHSVPTKGLSTASVVMCRNVLTCAEGKRSKLETETTTSTRGGSNEQADPPANRRLSSIQSDAQAALQQKPDPTQPIPPSRLPPGPVYASNSTSPANIPLSGFNSPRSGEQFSPTSASPRTTVLQRDGGVYDPSVPNSIRETRIPFDANPYHQPSAYNMDLHQKFASTPPPPYPHPNHFQGPNDMLSRRTPRDSSRLPPLSHEDTTLSSESGHSNQGSQGYTLSAYPGQTLPADPSKTMRMLPQPVPSIAPLASPLDRPIPPMPSHLSHNPHDYRNQGSLAVLVRAGELASRAVDDDMVETESSP